MAQAARVLELLDCSCFGCCRPDHFRLANPSFARCSGVTLSLRGHIECVVRWSRAGIVRDGLFVGMDRKDWDAVIQINLRGTYVVAREGARVMIEQQRSDGAKE